MDRKRGIGQFTLLARTGVWPRRAVVKTGGRVWNRRLPAVCPVGCHICSSIPGVSLARRRQPHCTDVCSSRARWQTVRRASGNQGCVSILAPNAGVVVPSGAPAPRPPCRTSLALSPSHLVLQRDLFRSFFLFLSPCHPLFLEEYVKGLDASDFLRWRDLLGDPSARPHILEAGVSLPSCDHPDL